MFKEEVRIVEKSDPWNDYKIMFFPQYSVEEENHAMFPWNRKKQVVWRNFGGIFHPVSNFMTKQGALDFLNDYKKKEIIHNL